MNWGAAVRRVWKLPVIWEASDPEPAPVRVTEVRVVYVAVPYFGSQLPGPLAAIARKEEPR